MYKVQKKCDNGNDRSPPQHSEALPPHDLDARLAEIERRLNTIPQETAEAVEEILRETNPRAERPPLNSLQACARLNISRRKLDDLVAAGKLRPLRIGKKRLFPAAQPEGFLRECSR